MFTCGSAQWKGLDDVSNSWDAAVRDHGDTEPAGVLCHFVDGCSLGPAHRHHCNTSRDRLAGIAQVYEQLIDIWEAQNVWQSNILIRKS